MDADAEKSLSGPRSEAGIVQGGVGFIVELYEEPGRVYERERFSCGQESESKFELSRTHNEVEMARRLARACHAAQSASKQDK